MAWLSKPKTRSTADDVPAFLRSVQEVVSSLNASGRAPSTATAVPEQFMPAVSAGKSLASRDHIISMIDGKPYRSLTAT